MVSNIAGFLRCWVAGGAEAQQAIRRHWCSTELGSHGYWTLVWAMVVVRKRDGDATTGAGAFAGGSSNEMVVREVLATGRGLKFPKADLAITLRLFSQPTWMHMQRILETRSQTMAGMKTLITVYVSKTFLTTTCSYRAVRIVCRIILGKTCLPH